MIYIYLNHFWYILVISMAGRKEVVWGNEADLGLKLFYHLLAWWSWANRPNSPSLSFFMYETWVVPILWDCSLRWAKIKCKSLQKTLVIIKVIILHITTVTSYKVHQHSGKESISKLLL